MNYYKIFIFVFSSLTFINAQDIIVRVYDTTALEEAISLKVVAFDTISSFENHLNGRSQSSYIPLLLFDFIHGIHESSKFEVLDSLSPLNPDIELSFKFTKLFTKKDSTESSNNEITSAELELIGIDSKKKNKVFKLLSSESSFHNVKEDELFDNMLDIMNRFDTFFDKYKTNRKMKSFQFYDNISCKSIIDFQYLFLRNQQNQNENLVCNMIMHDLQVICDEEKYPIKKVLSSEIDFLLKREKLDFGLNEKILSPKLQGQLIKRGINELIIFNNLRYSIPVDETLIKDVYFGGSNFEDFYFGFSTVQNADKADNIMCDLYILDINKNRCLLKTKLFGNNTDDIAKEAIKAIGEWNEKASEIKPCFD